MSSVQEYIDRHDLSKKVEEAINATVKSKPEEPLSFLADIFKKMSPPTITKVVGRQIYDSRGNPTVEADVYTHKGKYTACSPSGASTGIHEAVELRDGGKDYMGKGVLNAVENINKLIAPAILGMDPTIQKEVDAKMCELDGTENKGKLGANAILAVSIAVCKAGAAERGVPLYKHIADLAGNSKLVLPVPSFNVINGGSHAGNKLAMQEFFCIPTGAKSFSEAMKMASEVYHNLKTLIKKKYGQDACNVGDEGGFAPNIQSNDEGLQLVNEAIKAAGYEGKMKLGMDVAASEFYDEKTKTYDLDWKVPDSDGSQKMPGPQLRELFVKFCAEYPVITIEDPFDQDDWENTGALTAEGVCQVVGDDLLVTNPKRVKKAIEDKACNALLLKVNQIGTVSEAIEAVGMAKAAGWGVMASHRSGETEDAFIADLSVGLACGQIKTGAPCRSERTAKYNQLLRIEEELDEDSVYAGENWRFISWV